MKEEVGHKGAQATNSDGQMGHQRKIEPLEHSWLIGAHKEEWLAQALGLPFALLSPPPGQVTRGQDSEREEDSMRAQLLASNANGMPPSDFGFKSKLLVFLDTFIL